ncbi:MAG: protein-L-isoaspartate O-methyltransferase [Pseudomonadota bacterium]|nr:protein-L-isoaspartate O-methyltransferase [Pseudomonadota bacterium]
MDFQAARTAMVQSQLRPNRLTDERVTDALLTVPRERFLPRALANVAYADEDLPLGGGRYLMEPMVLARLLQCAAIEADEAVLHIGCASGYATAVMAQLASSVVAVESNPELVTQATETLSDLQVANAAVVEGDLGKGLPDQGPFDVILVEGAVAELPPALLDQLAEGGRLLAVLRTRGLGVATIWNREGGVIGHRALFDAATPVLPGFEARQGFVF